MSTRDIKVIMFLGSKVRRVCKWTVHSLSAVLFNHMQEKLYQIAFVTYNLFPHFYSVQLKHYFSIAPNIFTEVFFITNEMGTLVG
jgi:hypothetical protein